MFRHNAEDQAECLGQFIFNMPVPQEFQPTHMIELAIEMPDNLVDLGEHDEEADGFVFVEAKPEQFLVNHRSDALEENLCMALADCLDTREAGPPLVVDNHKVTGNVTKLFQGHIPECIVRVAEDPFRLSPDHGIQPAVVNRHVVSVLVEIVPESVCLEQFPVVWRVIGHTVVRGYEAVNQQSPPAVTFTEVDRSLHNGHTLFLQPVAAGVKQYRRSLPVINAFKKAHSAHLFSGGSCNFLTVESRYPANGTPCVVAKQPPCCLACT
ncbi:MAG: hypothetical protein BWY89_01845 [Bacteroidetes bacterium ADurb.BinA012]|nr:MAG: hypothetical protein BWY89_01845 [Bacteroidetes bacterium ADurb.BinA012]